MLTGIHPRGPRLTALSRYGAWAALLALLFSNVPLFLCMRLNGDASYYDLQAQCVGEGGVLYRDMLEPNLPGAVWTHMLVRALGGWSSVSLRAYDLLVVAAVAAILILHRDRAARGSSFAVSTLLLSIAWFYLSLSTWSHCQRDTWMLLPALVGLLLRQRSLGLMNKRASTRRLVANSLLEGAAWGAAFWIKPHVAVPAFFVLAASAAQSRSARWSLTSIAGVLAGGMVVGGVGSVWLVMTGAWPHFWETLLAWNPEYLASREHWDSFGRTVDVFRSFAPWSWSHLVALPVAVAHCFAVVRPRQGAFEPRAGETRGLLCALYLGWMLQSVVLQHPFSYTHVPGVILALAVTAGIRWPLGWELVPRTAAAMVFLIALLNSPCAKLDRLAIWKECVTRGPTPRSRAVFQARPGKYWTYYPELTRYLKSQNARRQDVLVHSSQLVPLYRDLDLRPPNRYVLTDVHAGFFPSRVAEIREAIQRSPHRFVVSDMSSLGIEPGALDRIDPRTGLPEAYPASQLQRFPATQPVVFRSGWFVVHRASEPVGPLWNERSP